MSYSCLFLTTVFVVYDTITLKSSSGVDEVTLNHLAATLNLSSITQRNGISTLNGRLKNLQVSANTAGIRVKGSAATFVNGSNVETFNWEDTGMYLDAISDTLSADFWQADVYRLDTAATIPVSAPVNAYLLQMGDFPGLTRTMVKNTLYYGTSKNAVSWAIYDKGKEAKISAPPHLLRLEMRIHRKNKLQKCGIGKGKDLTSSDAQQRLTTMWKGLIDKVQKLPAPQIDVSTLNQPKEVLAAFIAENAESYFQYIESVRAHGGLANADYHRRAKERAYDALKAFAPVEGNLIDELQNKVSRIAA